MLFHEANSLSANAIFTIFFEAAKDAQHPFRVSMNDTCSVKVLGTHFNVMAYPNERQKQIALLEGSVEVKAGGKTILVKPGNRG